MKQLLPRFASLIFGLYLYALGIVVTLSADIGYAPWEVFHAGIARTTGITIGNASIIMGVLIVGLVALLGEKIGLGTLLNMVLIGVFIDATMLLGVIPMAPNYPVGVVMLIAGMFIIALGSYFYIRSAFGAGPRDSLMVAFTRRTKIPIGVCRTAIELLVAVVGALLGGMLGVGTIISVVAIGFCVQITFKALKFDITAVEHQTFHLRKTGEKETQEAEAPQTAADILEDVENGLQEQEVTKIEV